ncbi:MAG: VWA domain-containing protein [Chitinophagales bacterium]|nr:VWA domain-containing protein [Chitinophagales bacterium]
MYTLYRLFPKKIATSVVFSLFYFLLPAQDILNPFPCYTQDRLPAAVRGLGYSITFDVLPGFTVTGVSGDIDLNLSIDASGHLSSTDIDVTSGDYSIDISYEDPGGSRLDPISFILPVEASGIPDVSPCIYDFAVILDRSGSMNTSVNATQSRWELVEDVVPNFINTLITAIRPSNDGIEWSIITFGGNTATVDASGTGLLPALPAATVSGNTPMGGGIQQAIMSAFDDLEEPGHDKNRVIILLTDGHQNRNPMVQVADPDGNRSNGVETREVNDVGVPAGILGAGSGFGTLPIDLNTSPLDEIQIYSIGIGAAAGTAVAGELSLLSDENGYQGAETADAVLEDFFDTTIPDAMEDSSPRIVDLRRGNAVKGQASTESFQINDKVNSITLKVTASSGLARASTRLLKDGNPVDMPPVIASDNMILYDINFPNTLPGLSSSQAIWSIQFTPHDNVAYRSVAIVDEEHIDYKLDFQGQSYFYAGDDLPVRLMLTYLDQPLNDDVQVKATLLRPGEDLGDLIANTEVPADLIQLREPNMAIGLAKYDYLLSDPEFRARLVSQTRTIDLISAGEGLFEGSFPSNNQTGNYRVIVEINGTHPEVGIFEGWDAKTAFFDFARPSDIELNAQMVRVSNPENSKQSQYQLTITPTNAFGKKLGPGQLHRILVDFNPKKKISTTTSTSEVSPVDVISITDNLDGSYSYTFVPVHHDNPTIDVYIIDKEEAVESKKLHKWIKNFGISLHGGMVGTINDTPPLDTLKGDYYTAIDLTYRLSPSLAIKAMGGRYQFDNDFDVTGGSLLLEYTRRNVLGNRGHLQAALGPGLFKPSNDDLGLGLNARLGVLWDLTPNLEIGLEGGAIILPTPDYHIGFAGVQIRYFLF